MTDPGNEFAIELDFFLNSWGALFRPSKIAKQAVFQAVLRGIGKSFQSAITAPRMNLTGYGNATAQSWLFCKGIEFFSKTSLSYMWDVTFQSRSWLTRMSINNFVLLYCAVRLVFIKNVACFYLAVKYSERQTSSKRVRSFLLITNCKAGCISSRLAGYWEKFSISNNRASDEPHWLR